MNSVDLMGWLAAAFTFSAFTMRTMLPLRLSAIVANCFFLSYGFMAQAYPIIALHAVLLPLNSVRLAQIIRGARRLRAATGGSMPVEAIRPYLREKVFHDGDFIFHKGDQPDTIYFLESGHVQLVEINTQISIGEMFGEVAFFSDDGVRTLSAKCHGECRLLEMDEGDFIKLFHQDHAFGFSVLKLMAQRLSSPTAPGAQAS